jgi:hypothetical protein
MRQRVIAKRDCLAALEAAVNIDVGREPATTMKIDSPLAPEASWGARVWALPRSSIPV